jgi:thymidylate synthase
MDSLRVPKRAISLMWNQRSVDTFLGLPFNIASYGLLLEIIAKEVNMIPDELIGNLGDTHLYLNHVEQAKEQIDRKSFELPKVSKKDEYHYLMSENIPFTEKILQFQPDWFKLENYQSHPAIKAPLSN